MSEIEALITAWTKNNGSDICPDDRQLLERWLGESLSKSPPPNHSASSDASLSSLAKTNPIEALQRTVGPYEKFWLRHHQRENEDRTSVQDAVEDRILQKVA